MYDLRIGIHDGTRFSRHAMRAGGVHRTRRAEPRKSIPSSTKSSSAASITRLHDAAIRAFYERLLAAGKNYKVAIIACIRKLNFRHRELDESDTCFTPHWHPLSSGG